MAEAATRWQRVPWRKLSWGALELAVVLLLLSVSAAKRLLELEELEVGGDALKVWEFARNLVMGGDMPNKLNHHTMRFGLVLPAMLVQALFGSQATSYFIAPLAASVLLNLWVYLIVRKLSGPVGGAVAVMALLAFPPMIRASSQILPEGFGPMYAAFSTYAALLYTEAKTLPGRWSALIAAGMGLIFAYGAKLVFLFYAPGIAFIVWFGGAQGPLLPATWLAGPSPGADAGRMGRTWHWLVRSKLLVPSILALFVVAMMLVETLFLRGATGAESHFHLVASSHGASGKESMGAAAFFALYTEAPNEWLVALGVGLVAWLGVTAFARDRRSKLVALTLLVFLLLQTFIVRSIDPLIPWIKPHPRYLLGLVGPLAMVLGIFVGDALESIGRRDPGSASLVGGARFFSLAAALVLLAYSGSGLKERYVKEWGKKDAWTRTSKLSKELTQAYKAGIPIVSETPLGKPAWAAAAVLIDPAALQDGSGRPVLMKRILRGTGSKSKGKFVARAGLSKEISPKRLRNAVGARALGKKCAINLRQSIRFLRGKTTYSKECISLEQEFRDDPNAGKEPPKDPRKRKRAQRRTARRDLSKPAPDRDAEGGKAASKEQPPTASRKTRDEKGGVGGEASAPAEPKPKPSP